MEVLTLRGLNKRKNKSTLFDFLRLFSVMIIKYNYETFYWDQRLSREMATSTIHPYWVQNRIY
jgi:hypothetical protein